MINTSLKVKKVEQKYGYKKLILRDVMIRTLVLTKRDREISGIDLHWRTTNIFPDYRTDDTL